jgi:cysteine desulfurase
MVLVMIKHKQVYLDYAATTPVDPRVFKAMKPYFENQTGNTMSLHQFGRRQAEAVEKSRKIIANFLGARNEEIVFTASATESNNMVIKGIAWANRTKGKHLMISSIEHDCVRESARWLKSQGWEVEEIPVDGLGRVDLEFIKKHIKPETVLVSVIHGNNEVGTVQDIKAIGEICRRAGVYFHTDAAQSFGKEPISVEEMKIDLLTASSHKIYGPKGAAILYIKQGVNIEPLLHGGGHESGRRSSTVNVAAIVGMAKAIDICSKIRDKEDKRLRGLSQKLIDGVVASIEGVKLNGDPINRLANNVNLSFEAVEGEALLMELDGRGVAVSTGSACSSNTLEPSHVLMAMGKTAKEAHGSLRFSVGRWTTAEEINYTLKVLKEAVEKMRKISPFKINDKLLEKST